MAKILTVLSLVFALLLFPPATMAIISQNAVPGDSTYPIKRKLEDGILLFASITPTTKAWFSLERSNRRYKEAAILLNKGDLATQTLNELVDQTTIAAQEITQVQSVAKKEELINQLSQSIKQYDQGLLVVEKATVVSNPVSPQPTVQPTIQPTVQPTIQPTAQPIASPTPVLPSPQPVLPPIAPAQTQDTVQTQGVAQTRKDLEKIAKFLEEEKSKLKQQNDGNRKKDAGNEKKEDQKELKSIEQKETQTIDDKKSNENSKGRKN